MTELSTQIYKTPPLTDSLVEAHIWIARGYRVLPCQPGTKKLIAGFGPYLQDLTTAANLEYWFRFRHANLAVSPPQGGIILDFDDPEIYDRFINESPEAASSYTEESPRGGYHVFLAGEGGIVPNWGEIIPGMEIKRIALVYPSQVQGRKYRPSNKAKILTVNLAEALQGFAAIKQPDPVRSVAVSVLDGKQGHSGGDPRNRGILAEVKASWPILSYLVYFESKLVLTGNGRWRSGRCPWHDDQNPSLWVDTVRGLWGCHGCGAHGDVLNWHARRLGITNQSQAARDLAGYKVKVVV